MKRMNLRDVPDDVYNVLAQKAALNHMSLNAFVVDQLAEITQYLQVSEYVSTYEPPRGTGISGADVVTAIREIRDASWA